MSPPPPSHRQHQDRDIQKILDDPILLRKLSDLVFDLLAEDIRNQCDRQPNYWGK
ncbi:hypothetical protein [Baaleninema simplex]|uniref:hypothetical protein n=1 Tax=Baaleninema simplex TaxID=2862350 RepID=UPI0003455FEB|nr:hypothetical protein [Baaleninema simplex]